LENGRWPEDGDGEAWEARRRLIEANLHEQVRTPPLPNETLDGFHWRRRTARQGLRRLGRLDYVAKALDHIGERTAGRESRRPR
jgi:hypothetical protein